MSVLRFIKYNNALPIALSFLLLSFGGAFAASPEVRDAVYGVQERVVSIDNTYISSKDLTSYTPRVQITGVTEDEQNYYVHYAFTTIGLRDAVWQDLNEDKIMEVSKNAIKGRDLGLYVTEQLKQNIDRELSRLREVQEIERRNISSKIVATQYSGLIGKLLDDTTEELPGYVPVVVPVSQPMVGEISENQETVLGSSVSSIVNTDPNNTSADFTPPSIQILGNNPARIIVRSTYADLGVVVTDNVNTNLGYKTYLNGSLVTEVQIPTSEPGEWAIRYEATDQAGNMSSIERTVSVYDPNAPQETPLPGTSNSSASSSEAASSSESSL